MRNLFCSNIHHISTHPKALLFAFQNGIRNLHKPLMAEIRATEIGIEARHGQDYPIGVLGLVSVVVGYECVNDLCGNILWCKCGNRLNILVGKRYFILAKRAKLQGIGKDIVKAEHPRAFGGAREDRCLELLDLVAQKTS